MATEVTDFEQMMKTLAKASSDPHAVTVGDFAKAIQSLQAELKMLETEVSRLGSTVNTAFENDAVNATQKPARVPQQAAPKV